MARGKAMLSIRNVSKSFQQNSESFKALEDVSLDIGKGEFIAVVGPSGCGKTTLLKILAGLSEPSGGSIETNGENPTVGFVFQNPNLLEWRTAKENIRLPLELQGNKKRNVKSFLQLVGMGDFRNFLPGQLSGGMQQRVAIARALSLQPQILLLDEPFSSLDDFSREALNIELLNVWQKTGKTILFVTHNLEEAVFLADKIVVLSERPARVKAVLPVSLERPRKPEIKHSPEFQGHVRWLKSTLKS